MKLKVLDFIVEYKKTHNGNSPSNREICLGCGIPSTSTVNYYLLELQESGLIILPGKKVCRSIEVIGWKWAHV
jgi:SOS-response transcriptional repressor LexA